MRNPMKRSAGPGDSPRRSTIFWRLVWTWLQTLLGTALLGALVTAALLYCGLPWSWGAALLSLWMIVPILGWYHSDKVVRRLTGCRPPNPYNPDHMRLVRIVERLYPKTGLPVKPPVYVSPIKLPNAFATGRTPRCAFIAATEGLFAVGLTDEELEAVLAHELAHVRTYDVAINSALAAMGALFSLVLAAGLPRIFGPALTSSPHAPLLDELSRRVKEGKKRFFLPTGGVAGFIVMLILFYIVSSLSRLVTLFVTRVRESAADVLAVKWTGKPCALSMALQKIVIYTSTHAHDLRNSIITRGLKPLLLVNPFDDSELESGTGLSGAVRRWWRGLGENHPPVSKRLDDLDHMSGGHCPRVI